jgi:hypothetical protein
MQVLTWDLVGGGGGAGVRVLACMVSGVPSADADLGSPGAFMLLLTWALVRRSCMAGKRVASGFRS